MDSRPAEQKLSTGKCLSRLACLSSTYEANMASPSRFILSVRSVDDGETGSFSAWPQQDRSPSLGSGIKSLLLPCDGETHPSTYHRYPRLPRSLYHSVLRLPIRSPVVECV